jgi:hypothetical protein
MIKTPTPVIDFQSDDSQFGRGERHLSAILEEGDVVVYQTGSWQVDGVEVGDGSPPVFELARIETIQLVWTHNCEHGVLRGVQVERLQLLLEEEEDNVHVGFQESEPLHPVEFGPEQLVARIPVTWDDKTNQGRSLVPLDTTNDGDNDSLWRAHSM